MKHFLTMNRKCLQSRNYPLRSTAGKEELVYNRLCKKKPILPMVLLVILKALDNRNKPRLQDQLVPTVHLSSDGRNI